jgi:hypothetical protein
MENRAAVFASQPQDVEVYRDGAWWPGFLLGWRHDVDGGCQAWVRLAVGGVEENTWLALDYLRLPEPSEEPRAERHLAVVDAPATGDPFLTSTMAAIRAVPAPRGRRPGSHENFEQTATMSLVAVRDLPAEVATATAAPTPPSVPRPAGGRRRAPETATDDRVLTQQIGTAAPGRHRAPAPAGGAAGRHRAADTGVWPAVRDDDRAELSRPTSAVPVPDDPDASLFTRPIRLGDLVGTPREGAVPQPRRVHRDGRLRGV